MLQILKQGFIRNPHQIAYNPGMTGFFDATEIGVDRTRNAAYSQGYRGFESLPLRQNPQQISALGLITPLGASEKNATATRGNTTRTSPLCATLVDTGACSEIPHSFYNNERPNLELEGRSA